MAGYTRQSTASILNGQAITAPPLTAEFNQLASAFNASSGHTHDGSTGNSNKINLVTSVTGFLPAANGGIGGKNKSDATAKPVATNDASEGFAVGSVWTNVSTGRVYICIVNTNNSAVWRELVQVTSGNSILPDGTDTVDLGSNGVRFQDLFLSGGISAALNVAVGGTLNVTGLATVGGTLGVTGLATMANLTATGTTTITSIDLNSGAIDSTTIGTSTPAAGTFTTLNANTSLVAATADINGGTVDGATIGASTPSTGSFTTLGASGTTTLATVDINSGAIDGTTIGASSHTTGKFTTLQSTGAATLASVNIDGGAIDGTTIGASATSSGAFTTVTASGGFTGALAGNVTGNTAGVHTGAVSGNVTGNLTGNVTASSGSSTFTDVVVNGTLNMNAGTSATITNLTAPSADLDAATKKYVDDEISTLVGDAGAGLNTLGELADALNDDDAFSTTVTNSIATKLPKAGGTMTGAIAMGTSKITGLGDPTANQDASTKAYTDAQRNTRLATAGGTMSGAIAMGNNKVTGLATPTAGTDATTKTYVDTIHGSAVAAATSASNASTSASNAATSETNASNSATASANSATSAAASLDLFDDRFLGAKSSAPSVDNDGNALVVGTLYFDTTASAMKVYSGSGWVNAGSSVNGTTNRFSYTATANQTVFSATYDAGFVDVFLNGVKQLVGTDVTATSGTSVVFASGTSVNDIVEIVGYGTFVLADHPTQTQADARYVNLSGNTMTGNLTVPNLVVSGLVDGVDIAARDAVLTSTTTTANAALPKAGGTMSGALNVDAINNASGNLNILSTQSILMKFDSNNDQTNREFNIQSNTGTQLFKVQEDGNVGIGSGSTDSLIARTAQGYLSTRVNNFNITSGSSAYAFTGVNLYQDANGAYKYIDTGASSSIHYWGGDIQFHTAASGSADATQSGTTRMTINNSGNVGINTSLPSEKLSTVGNVNIGNNDSSNPLSYLRFGATQYGAADIRPSDEGAHKVGLDFYTDGTGDATINPTFAMRISGDNKVGIGIIPPAGSVNSKLNVQHALTSSYSPSSFNGDTVLRLGNNNVADNYVGIGFNHEGGTEGFFGWVRRGSSADVADFVFQGYDGEQNTYRELARINNQGMTSTRSIGYNLDDLIEPATVTTARVGGTSATFDYVLDSNTSSWSNYHLFVVVSTVAGGLTGNAGAWYMIQGAHYNGALTSAVRDSGGNTSSFTVTVSDQGGTDPISVRLAITGMQSQSVTTATMSNRYGVVSVA